MKHIIETGDIDEEWKEKIQRFENHRLQELELLKTNYENF